MKEELQQIQAVAVVTFLCILISVHSNGDYGEWFQISGTRQDVEPVSGNSSGAAYTFQYTYFLDGYESYNSGDKISETINYQSTDCNNCVNKIESATNIKFLAYATSIFAISVAFMARNVVNNLNKKNLRTSLSRLKYVAILVLITGSLTTFYFYSNWADAVIQDENTINVEFGDSGEIGCIRNLLSSYGNGACEEYVPSTVQGETDRLSARINPIAWTPGIGFFVVLMGSLMTGGGTLYIIGNIDDEWKAILKKQELIERQQDVHSEEIDRNKDLLQEFGKTEDSLRKAEQTIEDVKINTNKVDYEGIKDLENELDRLTALNQSVHTLNNSLESKLKTARMATAEVEKRARIAEKELNDDLSAKDNLEKEIEDLRDKQEKDMRLSDRMTREIGSLRKMSDDAEQRAFEAGNKLKIEKPETVKSLESYDSVKASFDKTVEEKNKLEKEIMDLEQQILESNEAEKSASTERQEAARRRKEMDQEVKNMEKNKKRINNKFTTLTTSLEKAKKDLAKAREGAAVTLSELDLERQTIVELQDEAEKHRIKEQEIVELGNSLKELQEQVNDQKESNKSIETDLKEETRQKRKVEKDVNALQNASKQVSKVMEGLKKQFDISKEKLDTAIAERNTAERLLSNEKDEHEKLKEDLNFLQDTTLGSEEDTERKIKAMNIEIPKNEAQTAEMTEEASKLSEENQDIEAKIKEARVETVKKATEEPKSGSPKTANIGSSVIVKNLAKETEHNFQLVNPDQADPKSGKLPLSNPIAKALEGAKEGDEVKVGPNIFKILKLN